MQNYKDYRIGNLVEYDERVFEIHTLAEEFPTLNTTEFGIGVVDWNNVKPIKLTDKLFEDLGFIKEGEFYAMEGYDYKYCFKYRAWVDNWALYIEFTDSHLESDTDKKYPVCFSIKYIHQLQNLFYSLTKKELTLKKI